MLVLTELSFTVTEKQKQSKCPWTDGPLTGTVEPGLRGEQDRPRPVSRAA